jgi:hypothetical protein
MDRTGLVVLGGLGLAVLLLNKKSPGAGSPNAPPPPLFPPLQPVLVQPGLAPVQGANFTAMGSWPTLTSQAPGNSYAFTGVAPTFGSYPTSLSKSSPSPAGVAAPTSSPQVFAAPTAPGGRATAGSR